MNVASKLHHTAIIRMIVYSTPLGILIYFLLVLKITLFSLSYKTIKKIHLVRKHGYNNYFLYYRQEQLNKKNYDPSLPDIIWIAIFTKLFPERSYLCSLKSFSWLELCCCS